MDVKDIEALFLNDTNPFAARFNSRLLVIRQALSKWEDLNELQRHELLMIYNGLSKFAKDSTNSTINDGPEQAKKNFGKDYWDLMKRINEHPIYIEALKEWALVNERQIIERIAIETGVSIDVEEEELFYEDSIRDLQNSCIDEIEKAHMIAQLDLLRRASILMLQEEKADNKSK